MTTPYPADLTAFTWQRHPKAEELIGVITAQCLNHCLTSQRFAHQLSEEAGVRFGDLIDHLIVPASTSLEQQLCAARFECSEEWPGGRAFTHRGGLFPAVILSTHFDNHDKPLPPAEHYDPSEIAICIKVESIADFAATNGLPLLTADPALAGMRRLSAGGSLLAIERHGYPWFQPTPGPDPLARLAAQFWHDRFRCRRRIAATEEEAFAITHRLIDTSIAEIGRDRTTDLFFTAEREYWQRRNRAAQFQKARQDKLGLGWANHDHHTYRSSRKHFPALIALWEKLGFTLRERFYAGAQAGWGAQICEHPVCGIVTFNDVDLSPDELTADFSHDPLPERHHLGTVGLWCALHGESILQAGMHHLECQFDFDALKTQLEADANIKVMKPFTDFPHLRQAFTEGERWPVDPKRIDALLAANQITQEQAQTFRTNGAIGSHLENLERNEGFKGFIQTGVSDIIARTDPRLLNRPSPRP